jgi:hypothetical protein
MVGQKIFPPSLLQLFLDPGWIKFTVFFSLDTYPEFTAAKEEAYGAVR